MTRGTLAFIKAHGAGNDFLVLDEADRAIGPDLSLLAPVLCCRRTGVGADGLLVIRRGSIPHMECWNADGSRAESCGNGLRIVAMVLRQKGYSEETISTDSGPVEIHFEESAHDDVFSVEVSLGIAQVDLPRSISVGASDVLVTPVCIGNPHLVVCVDLDSAPESVSRLGPSLENSVPGRTNVGFVTVESRVLITLRVWERGCGETRACGTGAAAAFAALHRSDRVDDAIDVQMPGGTLQVRIDDLGGVHLRGPVQICYRGEVNLENLQHSTDTSMV
jgi:diaminopimelate epimerase